MSQSAEAPQAAQLDQAAVKELVEMIHFMASAKDAMSDDMVARIARVTSEGLTLLDRVTRNEGLMRLLQMLERPELQHMLMCFGKALGEVSRELSTSAPSKGGLGEMLRLAREPGTQDSLRVMSLFGQHLNEALRALHSSGGKPNC